jgi:hypothetical protein
LSSDYHVLCLSHDPAIQATHALSLEAAEQAIREGVDGHEACDLMIGAYSYPLVDLGCPGKVLDQPRPGAHRCSSLHTATKWADVAWIRILAVAQRQPEGTQLHTLTKATALGCFSPERLRRLREELQITWED